MTDKRCNNADIAAFRTLKPIVEPAKEPAQQAFIILLGMTLEHLSAERRRQRQGHEGRKADRYGNGQRELLIKDPRHTAEESNWDEYSRQDNSDGHNRPLNFVHRALRRIDRSQALFHMLLNVLNNDDRIIDNEADRKDHCKERQGIDRKVKYDKCAERTDQGNRDSKQRNDRRAPVLQEDENNKDNQQQRFHKGHQHLFNRRADIIGRIEDCRHLHARRQRVFCLIKNLTNFADRLHGIRIARKLDAEADRRISVIFGNNTLRLRSCLDFSDILEAYKLAVAIRLDDDIAEFLRRRQASFDLAGHLFFLTVVDRHRTDRTGRCLNILLLDRGRNVSHRQFKLGQFVWIEPDTHRVIGAENLDVTNSIDTL